VGPGPREQTSLSELASLPPPPPPPGGLSCHDKSVFLACAVVMLAGAQPCRSSFVCCLPPHSQISPWEGHEAATTVHQLPDMRLAQMAANELPLTGMATAVDLGPPANAHGWDSGDEHGPDPWGNVHFRASTPSLCFCPPAAKGPDFLAHPLYGIRASALPPPPKEYIGAVDSTSRRKVRRQTVIIVPVIESPCLGNGCTATQ
jgi:hypothetical protein